MADNILKGIIQIQATGLGNVAAAEKSLSLLEKQFQAFKGLKPFTNIDNEFKKFVSTANTIKPSTDRVTNSLINLSRVAQDAPYGFIGIANNLNPLLESFQRLRAESDSNKTAFKSLLAGLTGPAGIGLALGVVSSLVVSLGDKLFNLGGSFSEADAAAGKFDNSLKKIKDSVDDLRDRLNFESDLKKLTLDLQNFSAGGKDAASKFIDIGANNQYLSKLNKEIDSLTQKQNKLVKFRTEAEKVLRAANGEASPLARAVAITGSFDLPDDVVNKLDDGDKRLVERYKKTNETLKDLKQKRIEAFQSGVKSALGIAVDIYTEADKKIKEETEKALKSTKNDVVSKAKRIFAETKDIITLKLNIRADDSDKDQKAKAKAFLKDYFKGNYQIKVKSDIFLDAPPEIAKETGDTFAEYFYSGFREYSARVGNEQGGLGIQEAIKLDKQKLNIGSIFGVGEKNPFLSDEQQNAVVLAQNISGVLVPAFEGLVDSIGSGKDAFRSFFQSIGQGIKQIFAQLAGKAALAGILSLVFPGGIGGVKGFGSIFTNLLGFRATGGAVSSGGSYIVGERGPELFTPGVNGSIIPNGRMGSYGGGSLAGQVQFVISGNNLIGVMSAAGRNQRRLV